MQKRSGRLELFTEKSDPFVFRPITKVFAIFHAGSLQQLRHRLIVELTVLANVQFGEVEAESLQFADDRLHHPPGEALGSDRDERIIHQLEIGFQFFNCDCIIVLQPGPQQIAESTPGFLGVTAQNVFPFFPEKLSQLIDAKRHGFGSWMRRSRNRQLLGNGSQLPAEKLFQPFLKRLSSPVGGSL